MMNRPHCSLFTANVLLNQQRLVIWLVKCQEVSLRSDWTAEMDYWLCMRHFRLRFFIKEHNYSKENKLHKFISPFFFWSQRKSSRTEIKDWINMSFMSHSRLHPMRSWEHSVSSDMQCLLILFCSIYLRYRSVFMLIVSVLWNNRKLKDIITNSVTASAVKTSHAISLLSLPPSLRHF